MVNMQKRTLKCHNSDFIKPRVQLRKIEKYCLDKTARLSLAGLSFHS